MTAGTKSAKAVGSMASKAWADIERAVAKLVGGERSWDSRDHIDVLEHETGYALEVKNTTGPTVAQLERWLLHNQKKAAGRGMKSALIVKRRAGRGRPSPYLAVFQITSPEPDREN